MKDLIRNILREEFEAVFKPDSSLPNVEFESGKPLSLYTCEDLRELVINEKIYSQRMFKFYYPQEHKLAIKLECYPFIFDRETNEFGGINRRKIYTFKWEKSELDGGKKAYVGLAHDIYQRYKQHLNKNIGEFVKIHGGDFKFDVEDGFLPKDEAQCREGLKMKEMENEGYEIINADKKSRSLGACKRNIDIYEKQLDRVFKDKDVNFLKIEDPDLYNFLKKGDFHKIGVTKTPRTRNYCLRDLETKKDYATITCLGRMTGENINFLRRNFKKFDLVKDRFKKIPIEDCKKRMIKTCPVIKEQRLIIKKILSEEVNEQLIFKGIDILVNSLKQEYPYILDWRLADSLDEYKSTIYINLVVSYDDVEEFYGLKPRYEKFMYIGRSVATPMSPFKGRYDNEGVEEALKMNDYIEGMYEYIPNEMKMSTSFDEPNNYYKDYYKVVKIDNYIFVDERTN